MISKSKWPSVNKPPLRSRARLGIQLRSRLEGSSAAAIPLRVLKEQMHRGRVDHGEGKMAIDDFRDMSPAFIPEEFFLGDLEGWTVFESLTGGLLRRASIKAKGTLGPDNRRHPLHRNLYAR
jgi:hypothetical protein